MADAIRIDKWLWSTRRFKTRNAAATACTGGKVKLNGESAKPATRVKAGDKIAIRRRFHTETVEVINVIEKRVSAEKAAVCFTDLTSPEELDAARRARNDLRPIDPVYARRDSGAGRPTKKERRELDRLRRR